MRKILVLWLLMNITTICCKCLSIDEFFKTSLNDPSYLVQKDITTLNESIGNGFWGLQSAEIRYSVEDFTFNEYQYGIRFLPKGFGETRANKNYLNAFKELKEYEKEQFLSETLKLRAIMIFEYFETKKLTQLNQNLIDLYRDIFTVMKKRYYLDADFNINRIISTENKISSLQLREIQLSEKLSRIKYNIKIISQIDTDDIFTNEKLIDIKEIEKNIDSDTSKHVDNFSLLAIKQNLILQKAEYKLDLAKSRNFIKFIDVDYKSSYDTKTSFSIGVGIKIPFIENNKLSFLQQQEKILKTNAEFQSKQKYLQEEKIVIKTTIKNLILEYYILKERKDKVWADKSYKKHFDIDEGEPEILLNLRESAFITEIELIKISFLIRSKYIEYMDIIGRITQDEVASLVLGGKIK